MIFLHAGQSACHTPFRMMMTHLIAENHFSKSIKKSTSAAMDGVCNNLHPWTWQALLRGACASSSHHHQTDEAAEAEVAPRGRSSPLGAMSGQRSKRALAKKHRMQQASLK